MIDPRLPKFPKFFYLMWTISLVFGVAAMAAIFYVVMHFVMKFW